MEQGADTNAAAPIPADLFLERVISALTAADAPELDQLGAAAPYIAAPCDPVRFVNRHAAFAALLDASARNLRLLGRIGEGGIKGMVYRNWKKNR